MNEPTEEQVEGPPWMIEQQKRFDRLQSTLNTCRDFVENHKEVLSQIKHWTCWGWDLSLDISIWEDDNPKQIAKLFGADGWVRLHNSSACGQIDWQKNVDGILVTLAKAENIKPKLIEEVKLT